MCFSLDSVHIEFYVITESWAIHILIHTCITLLIWMQNISLNEKGFIFYAGTELSLL